MGIRNVYSTPGYLNVATTRFLTVNSSLAQRVTMVVTGATALSIYNQGSTSLVWGDSNVTINSGNYLFPSGRIEWQNLQEKFEVFLVSDSISGVALGIANVTEYKS